MADVGRLFQDMAMNTLYDPQDKEKFPTPIKKTPAEFFSAYSGAAQAIEVLSASKGFRIPASFTLAQSALESAWDGSILSSFAKNYFGMKADSGWAGDTFEISTREVIHGISAFVIAKFRAYSDYEHCMQDHALFLTNDWNPVRYKAAFETDTPEAFAQAIAAGGYATDPTYAQKIIEIMDAHNLKFYDQERSVS
jgi:flagellum-specific peptidoglycan hydrolase FlgJ